MEQISANADSDLDWCDDTGRGKREKNPELCLLLLPPVPDGEMITENQIRILSL